jgi:hypothetical protein
MPNPTSSLPLPNQPSPPISSSTPISSSPSTQDQQHTSTTTLTPTHSPSPILPQHSPQMTTRAQHGIVKPHKLFNLHTSSQNSTSLLPTNHIDALHDPNWKMAMKDEYDALIVNKT